MKYIFILLFFFSGNAYSKDINLKQYEESYNCQITEYLTSSQNKKLTKDQQVSFNINFKHYPNSILKEQLKSKNSYSLNEGFGVDLQQDKTLLFGTDDGNLSSTVKVTNQFSELVKKKLKPVKIYQFYDQFENAILYFHLTFYENKNVTISYDVIQKNKSSMFYNEINSIANNLEKQINFSKAYNDYSLVIVKLNELFEYSEKFHKKYLALETPNYVGNCKKI